MTRWDYVTEILMPAAVELWRMEDFGLRVDLEARKAHGIRLTAEEAQHAEKIRTEPRVADALTERSAGAIDKLQAAEFGRDAELEAVNVPRAEWEERMESIKLQIALAQSLKFKDQLVRLKAAKKDLGKAPKLVRKSGFTAEVAAARALVERCKQFNPGSSQQKAWLLYDALGLPAQKHPKTKAITTDKRALAKLGRLKGTPADARTVLKAMLAYEHANQLRTTFVECELKDGRLFPSYGLHRTGTGRIASGSDKDEKARLDEDGETNAQNWPKILRDIVIPEDGMVFVQGDWSQVEWLITLLLAGDAENFKKTVEGQDSHIAVASILFNKPYEAIASVIARCKAEKTKDCKHEECAERQIAKKANHGSNYGMGADKLADEIGISIPEARKALLAIKAAYPRVAAWRGAVVEEAQAQRYLETPFGWRRYFWGDDVPASLAFKPSATGADMLKIRLPLVAKAAHGFGGRLVTTTHDSFLCEVPLGLEAFMQKALTTLMTAPFVRLGNTSFPCDVKIGGNWKAVS